MRLWTKVLFMFLVFFLIFGVEVEAKSGCCSSHGGVNCAAGPQSNGHVICNDGSRNSSCLYSEMVMCGGSSSTSTETVQTTKPTPTTRPTWVPTKVPTIIITTTQTPTPTEPEVLTATPTLQPTLEATSAPTSEPQVLGEETVEKSPEPPKSGEVLSGFGLLGGVGFGVYKLIKRVVIKLKDIINR